MSREEAIKHIKDIICENNSIKPSIVTFEQEKEALYMAISALEQKSCEDLEREYEKSKALFNKIVKDEDAISREAVLEKAVYTETEEGWWGYRVDVDYIKSLPSVTPKPTECEDAIRRDAVRQAIDEIYNCTENMEEYANSLDATIEKLPSVTLQRNSNTDKKHVGNTLEDAVSREAIIDLIKRCYPTEEQTTGCLMIESINKLPSVTQKSKTGHWILDETDNSITCDKCGCLIWANDISNGDAHYCPNCGAEMESK